MTRRCKTRAIERVWDHVEVRGPDECWPWIGATCRSSRNYQQPKVAPGPGEVWSSVPRIILSEKLGRPLSSEEQTLHSCDWGLCCNPAHLTAGTQAENNADKMRRDRNPRGEAHWAARLTDAQIVEIRSDQRPSPVLAGEFGVTARHIRRIQTLERRR